MSSEDLYYHFQLILNKNASLKNVNITRPNFVILYNREALRWLENYIKLNSSTQSVHNVHQFLVTDQKLSESEVSESYYLYDLPEDYFEFSTSKSLANKDKCSRFIYNYLEKPKDLNTLLDDGLSGPSFEFEESLCNISKNKLQVFVDDYKINSTYLSYYKKPQKIDLSGYTNINDGSYSQTIDTDLDERYQTQIIDLTVLEVMRQFENNNGLTVSQNRINK